MSAYTPSSHVAELSSKIKSVRFAMLTNIDRHGHLVSRPMTKQDVDANGDLWFFTSSNTTLWEDIASQPNVNASFSEPADSLYVSVSGRAERVVDRAKVRELWNPMVEAWFPNGPDDPHVMLIKLSAHSAEFWDVSASKMVQMFQMAKAVLTGSTPEAGEHGKIKL